LLVLCLELLQLLLGWLGRTIRGRWRRKAKGLGEVGLSLLVLAGPRITIEVVDIDNQS
jgi:hypothetical protein